jgi:CRP/FNR family transcriptional regulator
MIRTGARSSADEAILGGPATLASIFAGQVIERLDAGDALFWQGDAARDLFEVVSGALRTVRVLSDGRRVITGFLFAGDVVGVSLKDRYLATVEAIAPTEVRRLRRHHFEDLIERRPSLRPQLIEHLCDEMTAAQEQVVLLARKSAEERVASFLLSLVHRRYGQPHPGYRLFLPMTRLDVADYLGLTIETVSRIMTRLVSRDIIANQGRFIVIKRPAALAEIALDDDDGDLAEAFAS